MLFAFAAVLFSLASAQLMINTPTGVVQCQVSLISWGGSTGPYFVSVLPGNQPSAAPLEVLLSSTSATTYSWTVDLAAGTLITLSVKDGTGAINYSSAVTIGAGSASCLNKSSGAAGASSSAAKSGASSAAVPAASTPSAAAPAVTPAATPIAASPATKASSSMVTSSAAPVSSPATAVNSTANSTVKAGSARTGVTFLAGLGAGAALLLV